MYLKQYQSKQTTFGLSYHFYYFICSECCVYKLLVLICAKRPDWNLELSILIIMGWKNKCYQHLITYVHLCHTLIQSFSNCIMKIVSFRCNSHLYGKGNFEPSLSMSTQWISLHTNLMDPGGFLSLLMMSWSTDRVKNVNRHAKCTRRVESRKWLVTRHTLQTTPWKRLIY